MSGTLAPRGEPYGNVSPVSGKAASMRGELEVGTTQRSHV
jgi:hypothetical protein